MLCACCEEECTQLTSIYWLEQYMNVCADCKRDYSPKYIQSSVDEKEFKFKGNHSLFYGVEFELNVKQDEDHPTLGMENICHLEYQLTPFIKNKDILLCWDRTIVGDGFEVVTSPMNLSYQLELWKDIFNAIDISLLGNMKECGVHIHFSKGNLTTIETDLLLLFLHRNNQYAYQIGKRQSVYAQLEFIADIKSLESFKRWVENSNKEKEIGFNYTPLHTNELRIFKSTKKLSVLKQYLNWTNDLIHFIKRYSQLYVMNNDLTWLTKENFECFINLK